MAVFSVKWPFWTGKSSFGSYVAKCNPNAHIRSNIPMNTYQVKNYHFFEDDAFLEVFRTINLLNDIERVEAWYEVPNNSLVRRHRHLFSNNIIIFDEIWSIRNNHNWKNVEAVESEYINTERKNFTDIYLVWADTEQADKSLRRFAWCQFYVSPLWDFPMFRDFKVVRMQYVDKDWNVKMERYLWRDSEWYEVVKDRPMDYYYDWFYQPLVRSYYDDLYKNIRDPDKYKVNLVELEKVLLDNPVMLENLYKHFPKFFEVNKDALLLMPKLDLCID